MFKKSIWIACILSLLTVTILESCKNQCDSCPGIVKRKKVRKSSKGSL